MGSDWARVESQTFRFTDPVNRDLRFIPLRLDETEPRASLRQFAYVDWRGGGSDEAYARLLSACRRRQEHTAPDPQEMEGRSHRESRETVFSAYSQAALPQCMAWRLAPMASRIISGSADNIVRVYDLGGNAPPRAMGGHIARVYGVSISADGKRAVSGSADMNVRVWDLDGDAPPRVLRGHMARVSGAAISADGKRAISGSDDNTVRVWNLDSGAQSRV